MKKRKDALKKYGCFRLASRISDLRKSGMNIDVRLMVKGNKKFAEYRKRSIQLPLFGDQKNFN